MILFLALTYNTPTEQPTHQQISARPYQQPCVSSNRALCSTQPPHIPNTTNAVLESRENNVDTETTTSVVDLLFSSMIPITDLLQNRSVSLP